MDETWVLIDPNTGLHVGWYFWLRVLDEVNRSQRYGEPFGLLLLEAQPSGGRPQRALEEAAAVIPSVIRSTDLGGLISPGRVGVLLTHQNDESAGRAQERIHERIAVRGPRDIDWSERLLTYPADAAEISLLLTAGWPPGARADRERLQRPA